VKPPFEKGRIAASRPRNLNDQRQKTPNTLEQARKTTKTTKPIKLERSKRGVFYTFD